MPEVDTQQAELIEAGRVLFARPINFMLSVVRMETLPPPDMPEICFAGRSNVGKSSLINALTNRKDLARASNTPGRTRELNYFNLDDRIRMVDLPGYGYARAPKTEIAKWTALTRDFLRGRAPLRRIFLLIDSRHGLKESDLEIMSMLDEVAVTYQIVLTKVDKIKPPEVLKVLEKTQAAIARRPAAFPVVITTSSVKKTGLDMLKAEIASLALPDVRLSRTQRIACKDTMLKRRSNETGWTSAKTLSEALPFIQRYAGRQIVIKFGGHAMGDKELTRQFANDVVLLKQFGLRPVIVHGGGPQIGKMLERLNIKSEFVDGLRVSDIETVEIAEMVLSGAINKSLVEAINAAGGRAVGLSGKDAKLITAKKVREDLGWAGEPVETDVAVLNVLASADPGFIPVVSPISGGEDGATYNVNADTAAGILAASLGAVRLMLLTDVEGVMDADKNLLTDLSTKDARKLIKDGTAIGGMIPKLETAIAAIEGGVEAVVILDGRRAHGLLVELFTDQGAGTLIG